MTPVLILTVALGQPPGPASDKERVDTPSAASTTQKVETFGKRVQEIRELTDQVKKLEGSDPNDLLSRRDNEDSAAHVARVGLLLKARGLLLVRLAEHYEEALIARYTVEYELAAYNRWIKHQEKSGQKARAEAKLRLEQLGQQEYAYRRQVFAMADALRQKLRDRLSTLLRDKKIDRAKQPDAGKDDPELAELERRIATLTTVVKETTIEQDLKEKYEAMTLPELEKQYRQARLQFQATLIELGQAGQFAGVQSSQYFYSLEQAQREGITRARTLLVESELLEEQAAEVEIYARYTQELLRVVSDRVQPATISAKLDRRARPELDQALKSLGGGPAREDGDFLRLLRAAEPGRATPAPPPKTPAPDPKP